MQLSSVPHDIRLLLESCRDEAELQHAEMAPLRQWLAQSPEHRRVWEAVRDSDRRVRHALHSVDVPTELAARVPATGAAMSIDADELSDAFAIDDSHSSLLPPSKRPAEPSLRRRAPIWRQSLGWVAAAGALAASVLLYVNWPRSSAPVNYSVSARDLCEASLDWIAQADQDQGPWYIKRQMPGEGEMLVARQMRWKRIKTDAGTVDCYLANLPDGRRVYQFELPADRRFQVADHFSDDPDLPSEQFTCSARRHGDRIIVIAVEGGLGEYRQVLSENITSLERASRNQPLARAIVAIRNLAAALG